MKKRVSTVTAQDCEWQFFRAGGKGGQAQNKKSSGVRCIHHPSGAVGEARDQREQLQNRRAAFRRMAETKEFQFWARKQAGIDSMRPSVEEVVREQMLPHNLRTEVFRDGKWVEDCA